MKTKIFKSTDINSLKNKVKTFQKQNEIVIVNESSFFDRIGLCMNSSITELKTKTNN